VAFGDLESLVSGTKEIKRTWWVSIKNWKRASGLICHRTACTSKILSPVCFGL
jgi:hypothetical protein